VNWGIENTQPSLCDRSRNSKKPWESYPPPFLSGGYALLMDAHMLWPGRHTRKYLAVTSRPVARI